MREQSGAILVSVVRGGVRQASNMNGIFEGTLALPGGSTPIVAFSSPLGALVAGRVSTFSTSASDTSVKFTDDLSGTVDGNRNFSGRFRQICFSNLASRARSVAGTTLTATATGITGTLVDSTFRLANAQITLENARSVPINCTRR